MEKAQKEQNNEKKKKKKKTHAVGSVRDTLHCICGTLVCTICVRYSLIRAVRRELILTLVPEKNKKNGTHKPQHKPQESPAETRKASSSWGSANKVS